MSVTKKFKEIEARLVAAMRAITRHGGENGNNAPCAQLVGAPQVEEIA